MELSTAIRNRRSCRSYETTPVPDNLIRECVEAARLAPSACNKQPWRFYAVTSPELREKLCSECLLPGVRMPWLRQAPVILVLCMKKKLTTHFLAPLLWILESRESIWFSRQKSADLEAAGSAGSKPRRQRKSSIFRLM